MTEKIEFPLKPYQKALLNVVIVAGITMFSTLVTGDMYTNPHIWHSAAIAGGMTALIQIKELLKSDLEDDSANSYTPLMFLR